MANPKKLATRNSRTKLRTQMDFNGINIETKAKLNLMAANRGIPLYQLLDEMVEEAFEKQQYTLVRPRVAHKFLKEVRKLLRAQVRAPDSLGK
jgi:hypothetical protein